MIHFDGPWQPPSRRQTLTAGIVLGAGAALLFHPVSQAVEDRSQRHLGHAVSFEAVDGFKPVTVEYASRLGMLARPERYTSLVYIGQCLVNMDFTTKAGADGLPEDSYDYVVHLSEVDKVDIKVQQAAELKTIAENTAGPAGKKLKHCLQDT